MLLWLQFCRPAAVRRPCSVYVLFSVRSVLLYALLRLISTTQLVHVYCVDAVFAVSALGDSCPLTAGMVCQQPLISKSCSSGELCW